MNRGPRPRREWQTFMPTPGKCNNDGLKFEYHLVALILLRILPKVQYFCLGSNVKVLQNFDDIFLKIESDGKNKDQIICIQLKHKVTPHMVTTKELMKNDGDFSIFKYYQSYYNIMRFYEENPPMFEGCSPEDFTFILYTNCPIHHSSENIRDGDLNEVLRSLNTGEKDSSIFSFTIKDYEVWTHPYTTQIRRDYREFLGRLKVYNSQTHASSLFDLIKAEIKTYSFIRENTSLIFMKRIEEWWNMNGEKKFLSENCPEWYSLVMEDLNYDLAENLKCIRNRYKFENCSNFYLEKIFSNGDDDECLNIVVSKVESYVKCFKLWCELDKFYPNSYLIMSVNDFRERIDLVLTLCEKYICTILVIDVPDEYEHVDDLPNIVPNSVKLLILSSKGVSTKLKSKEDEVWKYEQLTEESKDEVRRCLVDFQGECVMLQDICSEEFLTECLDAESIAKLITGDKIVLGSSIRKEETDKSIYISRRLRHQSMLEEEIFTKPPDNASAQEDEQCLHEDSLLEDWKCKLTLITGEPGMGKSRLLHHLATKTKEKYPNRWVVHISLIDVSSFLRRISRNSVEMKHVYELLFDAKENENCSWRNFSQNLLKDCLEKTGNIVIILDAVDEIFPTYMNEVLSIIQRLLEKHLQQVWITSRTILPDVLKLEASSKSLMLEPFSVSDQISFLNSHLSTLGEENVRETKEIVDEIMKVAQVKEGRHLCDVPLHAVMIAKVFRHLKQRNALKNHISLRQIYDKFVDTKWEEYYTAQNMNTSVPSVSEKLSNEKESALNNYMQCAITNLFPDEEFVIPHVVDYDQDFLETVQKSRMEKAGIIQGVVDGKAKFFHYTFCEFLAAKWFKKWCDLNLSQDYYWPSPVKKMYWDVCNNFGLTTERSQIRMMFKKLLENNFESVRAFLNEMLSDGMELHQMVLAGNLVSVQQIFDKRVDINKRDKGGRLALHLAVSHCNVNPAIVKLLLEKGSSLDVQDYLLGWRPLKYADRIRSWDSAVHLLRHRANDVDMPVLKKEAQDKGVWTTIKCVTQYWDSNDSEIQPHKIRAALIFSFTNRYTELSEILLGVVKNWSNLRGEVELFHAVVKNDMDTLQMLLNPKSELNSPIASGYSALHQAAKTGNLDELRNLVKYTDLNTRDWRGLSALHEASRWNQYEAARLLLRRKARIDLQSKLGDTALHVAAEWGQTEVADVLLEFDADVNASNWEGNTPLHYAALFNQKDMISVLLSSKADKMLSNFKGWTALHLAARYGNSRAIRELVKEGNDTNPKDERGRTPLALAVANEKSEAVDLLIRLGANINIKDSNGMSPIHVAMRNRNEKILRKLLDTALDKSADISDPTRPFEGKFGNLKVLEQLGFEYEIVSINGIPLDEKQSGKVKDIIKEDAKKN